MDSPEQDQNDTPSTANDVVFYDDRFEQESDLFFDAFDDFPFYDCTGDRSDQSASVSSSSSTTIPASLRRRRVSAVSGLDSGLYSVDEVKARFKEKRSKKSWEKQEEEKKDSSPGSVWVDLDGKKKASTVTTAEGDELVSDSIDSESSSWLVFIATLVIKAIEFQVNLFVKLITLPVKGLWWFYTLIIDPFGLVRCFRGLVMRKLSTLWDSASAFLFSLLNDKLKEHKTARKLLLQCGSGLFWSVYVGVVLCCLLAFSGMVSGVLMRVLVEEPLVIREKLNFDYTKNSPVAFVPVISCSGSDVDCGVHCGEFGDFRSSRSRVIPPKQKVQVGVILRMPESEYNRNLGMFQVRVDFLTADGKLLASKSHPCMLRYKSDPIRLLLTFLKIAPLLAGYESESQKVELKIRGFTEGNVPTSCLKVMIEQRAEFRPGAGIPEIYDASVVIESELPFLKRIIWFWRKTMFVWVTMMMFFMELLCALVCCRPLILPRTWRRDVSNVNNSSPDNRPERIW